MTPTVTLIHGDSLAILKDPMGFRVNEKLFRADACVTDPPYELGFMGKSWDSTGIAYNKELWRGLLSVLKPGAHMLAFSGSRTSHRMTCAIEDAGWEIRDVLMWLYGTGFPKSVNIEKGIKKSVLPEKASQWQGWGTALKPAYEPITLSRTPFDGTLLKNVLARGTGAINIGGCKVEYTNEEDRASASPQGRCTSSHAGAQPNVDDDDRASFDRPEQLGRWPANIILDEESATALDEQTGKLSSGERKSSSLRGSEKTTGIYGDGFAGEGTQAYDEDVPASSGGASRFFYCSKPSRKERDYGCSDLPLKTAGEMVGRKEGAAGTKNPRAGAGRETENSEGGRNFHPTVKPIDLMRYLVRLVTPPGGTVIDPFMGSGTTGIAAVLEGFNFIGIEREADHMEICRHRIAQAVKDYETDTK